MPLAKPFGTVRRIILLKFNISNAVFKNSVGKPSDFPRSPQPQIAFSGRSNVGKSSLINTLLGRKSFARVSSAPGKTITINYFEIDKKLLFVDLPGYGYAKRSKEQTIAFSKLTDSYFTKNPSADAIKLVLQLIDVRTGPTDDDLMMIQFLVDAGFPFIIVLTKADKLSATALKNAAEEMKNEFFSEIDVKMIPFSSETRLGKEQVLSCITSAVSD